MVIEVQPRAIVFFEADVELFRWTVPATVNLTVDDLRELETIIEKEIRTRTHLVQVLT